MRELCIIAPVYNDWASLEILLGRIDEVARSLPVSVQVLAVDDGSTENPPDWKTAPPDFRWPALSHVELVQLAVNVGHQRAIAVGLCLAIEERTWDAVLVMDADGEDMPESIPEMLGRAAGKGDFCIVAQRKRRNENLTFRASYLLYKLLFRILTGRKIAFGNFSVTSRKYARRLVMIPDLWNNLAAAILSSRLPVEQVQIDRGRRYAGRSQMNFVGLVMHGLSSISVYAETIYVRLLLLTIALVMITVLAIPFVLTLRIFFPLHATPGWASTVSFGLVIIFLQVFLATITSILTLLHNRVQRLFVPYLEYKTYIASRMVWQDVARL